MKTEHTEKQKIATAADPVPVQLIKVADIVPDPKNQKRDDEDGLVRLCGSIERDGLIQPITVRINNDPLGEKYMIVAGERRWEAHRMLKRTEIEARVISGDSQLASVRKRAVENLIRENLNPIQEARQYAELLDTGMSQTEAAEMAGVDQSTMSNRLRILKLPVAVQKMIEDGRLSRAHGIALLRFEKWPELLLVIATLAANNGTGSKALEKGLPFEEHDEVEAHRVGVWGASLPAAWRKDPDVIEADKDSFNSGYFYVLDVKRWKAHEAAEQVRRAKEADAAKAAAAKGGKAAPSAEQLKAAAERRAAIERNNARRAKTKEALTAVVRAMRAKKVPTAYLAAKIIEAAVAGSFGRPRIENAFVALGLNPGAGVLPTGGSYGLRNVGAMAKLKTEDLLAVATLILLEKEAEVAIRDGQEVPEDVAGMAKFAPAVKPLGAAFYKKPESAKPAAKKPAAKVKKDWINVAAQVGARIKLGHSVAEIAKYCEVSEARIREEMAKQGLKESSPKPAAKAAKGGAKK